jgi:hypothetical protein
VVKVGSLPQNHSEFTEHGFFCISMVPICLIQAAIKAQVAPVAGSLKVPMTKLCTSGHLRGQICHFTVQLPQYQPAEHQDAVLNDMLPRAEMVAQVLLRVRLTDTDRVVYIQQ